MNKFIPFALPDIGEEEIREVVDSLSSGWLTTGPKTKRFEKEFSEFLGQDIETIAVNSATSGLHLALEALGIGPGDEVITTTHTFTATAEVVRYLGADPVFVDINLATFNIDTTKIEAAITPRTKAIVPVHFGGLACDMQAILEVAQKYNLKVVEDAAHAIPTTYQGQLIGNLSSDATVYSFYATKTVATGEGGMIVTRHPEVAKRARIMRLHGINRDAFDRYTSTKPSWHYEVVAPGFKYNMTDIAASLGIHQLKKAWLLQKKRAAIANRYDAELKGLPLHLPAKVVNDDIQSWHLYVIRLDDSAKVSRNTFIEQLAAKGVGCSVHYIPLHLHPYWRDTYKLRSEDFPCASYAYERIVSLPIYTKMTPAEQTRVIEAVKKTLT
ncbi:DegT/DnrJ/EryC1/StrS family aminotransferase [Mastigocoleus testarum]|uniref:UDP-4-amino-4, 6-dideoxy-N-acetyl-beta-L-altrosamine transaminase n=1 Tax=Mastigocoleus testarum BC008 TaxID=371196 RepID=A0A0V7ZGN6_9CYAN|nr:DegT/DnrJ/EryC1/StrS aminotransferase family protein [Mastigocoleus testarum]KST63643.1 UDP-4-amino-4,6-dideoxy-N-acetyl-beta-L-altrosamine transaminase [Mastigocoleus testarum BC008]